MPISEEQRRKELGLPDVLDLLALSIRESTHQSQVEFEWHKAHANLVTKQDLKASEVRIIAALAGASNADIAKITAKLKAGTDALKAAVAANGP